MYIKNVDVRVLTFLTYLQIDRAQKAELSQVNNPFLPNGFYFTTFNPPKVEQLHVF